MKSPWPGLLPLDIWYLVCQELASGTPEFDALFKLALMSRVLAGVALPTLYSVHEAAWTYRPDLTNAGSVCLWRSLALSSMGKTAYPYAHWIRVLQLGSLRGMLEEISRATPMREAFFQGDMDVFHPRHATGPNVVTRSAGANISPAQMDGITIRIGEAITASVSAAADRSNKAVAVAELESYQLPVDVLLSFISRLPTLRTLTLRAGSVLDQQVGQALREHCPSFRELCCYYCLGDDDDGKMAGCLLSLAPDSLERFQVISTNHLGPQTFTALADLHAKSLRMLHLSSLDDGAVRNLHLLSKCTQLESLILECYRLGEVQFENQDQEWFDHVGAWLFNSPSLTTLHVSLLPGITKLLADVLVSANLRLETLHVNLPEDDVDENFFAALGHQTSLEHLFLTSRMDPSGEDFEPLVRSVVKCKGLVRLMVYSALTTAQLAQICTELPRLEKLGFDGDGMTDDVWGNLLLLPRLNSVDVNATSCFSYEGIQDFITRLAEDPRPGAKEAHQGFSLQVSSQLSAHHITKEQERSIKSEIRKKLNGRFSMTYWVAIDEEENESDEEEEIWSD